MDKVETKVTKKQCQNCMWCERTPDRVVERPDENSLRLVDRIIQVRLPTRICRRHAPIHISFEGVSRLEWPWVEAEDWCGDWEGTLESLSYRTTINELGDVKTEIIKE